jgi:hypothetical protein
MPTSEDENNNGVVLNEAAIVETKVGLVVLVVTIAVQI